MMLMEAKKLCTTCGDCHQRVGLSGLAGEGICLTHGIEIAPGSPACPDHYEQHVYFGRVEEDPESARTEFRLVNGDEITDWPHLHPLVGKAVRVTVTEIIPGRTRATVPLTRYEVEQAIKDLTAARDIDATTEEMDDAIDGVIYLLARGLKR